MTIVNWLADLAARVWRWFFPPPPLEPLVHEVEVGPVEQVVFLPPTEDPAPALARHRFVVVGTPEHPKWLLFVCPCGCGQEVKLNLMARFHPRWRIDVAPEGLTVHPSVDMTTCGAHFWVRNGEIAWAGQAPS